MTPTSEPPGSEGTKSPARRSTKPKFEIPPEVSAPPADTWVYRGDAAPQPEPVAETPPPAQPEPAKGGSEPGPLLSAGLEVAVFGVAIVGRALLTAFSLFSAPLGITRRLFLTETKRGQLKS